VAGTATFALSRAAFGPRGAEGLSVFNWLTMVAYETEGLALVALAVLALLAEAGVRRNTVIVVGVVAVAALAQGVLPFIGYAAILRTFRILVVPFTLLFCLMAVLVLPKVHEVHHSGGWVDLSMAFAFSASAAGLGWTIQASDYSRYLPSRTPRRRIVGVVSLAGFVPSAVLMCLGAVVATAVSSATDPISGLSRVFPAWFLVPYLLVVIGQLLTINTLDLYSSGLTLQAAGVPISRMHAVAVDLVVSAGLTLVAVLSNSFNTLLNDLITLLIVWTVPWTAVFLVDWALRRGRIDGSRLVGPGVRAAWAGNPCVRGGVRMAAAVSMIWGMLAAALCVDTPAFTGPVSRAMGGADLSIPAGLLVAGGLYWLLARRTVEAEACGVGPGEGARQ
jgi:purine-cytosine permease-like protein